MTCMMRPNGFPVFKVACFLDVHSKDFQVIQVNPQGSEIKTKTVMDDPGKCLITAAEDV